MSKITQKLIKSTVFINLPTKMADPTTMVYINQIRQIDSEINRLLFERRRLDYERILYQQQAGQLPMGLFSGSPMMPYPSPNQFFQMQSNNGWLTEQQVSKEVAIHELTEEEAEMIEMMEKVEQDCVSQVVEKEKAVIEEKEEKKIKKKEIKEKEIKENEIKENEIKEEEKKEMKDEDIKIPIPRMIPFRRNNRIPGGMMQLKNIEDIARIFRRVEPPGYYKALNERLPVSLYEREKKTHERVSPRFIRFNVWLKRVNIGDRDVDIELPKGFVMEDLKDKWDQDLLTEIERALVQLHPTTDSYVEEIKSESDDGDFKKLCISVQVILTAQDISRVQKKMEVLRSGKGITVMSRESL